MANGRNAVPCPAQSVGIQFLALGAVGAAVAVSAHRDGVAAMQAARDERYDRLLSQRLARANVSAADAIDVAREAVGRVHDLELEVITLRRAVASRDALIRSLANDG